MGIYAHAVRWALERLFGISRERKLPRFARRPLHRWVVEAVWIGVLGGILGLFAGTIMSYHHVVYNTKVLTGWTFQYYYPYGVALVSLLASVLLCLLAGYFPAKQAASTPIVSAIGYE